MNLSFVGIIIYGKPGHDLSIFDGKKEADGGQTLLFNTCAAFA